MRLTSHTRAYLGSAGDAAIGGEIGSAVGTAVQAIVPIPGIGAVIGIVGSEIGGLFGPGMHYTPGGETFDASTEALHQGYFEMMQLTNDLRSSMGLPPASTIGFVGLGTPGCNAKANDGTVCAQCSSLNCGQVNAPLTGPYLAKLLGNPALASQTSEDDVVAMQKDGTFDAAIQMQEQIIQHLQFVQQGLEGGLYVVRSGSIVPASAAPPANDYQSVTGVPAAPPPGSYADTQQNTPPPSTPPAQSIAPAGPLAFVQANAPLVFGGAAFAILIVLLARR